MADNMRCAFLAITIWRWYFCLFSYSSASLAVTDLWVCIYLAKCSQLHHQLFFFASQAWLHPQSAYWGRVELEGVYPCPLSWSMHLNFVRDCRFTVMKGDWRASPALTSLGWFFHHGMYARKWPLPLYVSTLWFHNPCSTDDTIKTIAQCRHLHRRNVSLQFRHLVPYSLKNYTYKFRHDMNTLQGVFR